MTRGVSWLIARNRKRTKIDLLIRPVQNILAMYSNRKEFPDILNKCNTVLAATESNSIRRFVLLFQFEEKESHFLIPTREYSNSVDKFCAIAGSVTR